MFFFCCEHYDRICFFFFSFSFISFYLDARQLFFLSSLLLRQLHKFLSHTYTSILRTFTLRRYIFFLFFCSSVKNHKVVSNICACQCISYKSRESRVKNCISHIPREKVRKTTDLSMLFIVSSNFRTFISTFLVVVARSIFTDVPVIQTLVHCDVWYVFIPWTREYIETFRSVLLFQTITYSQYSNAHRTNKLIKLFKTFGIKTSLNELAFRYNAPSTETTRSCFGHLRLLNRWWSKITEARVALDSTFSILPRDIRI